MYRLKKVRDGKLFGVVGGLSKYIDPELDPVVARILWVMISIFSPVLMTLLYLVLAVVLKKEDLK